MNEARWSPGSPITLRHVYPGGVWCAFPMTVVEDSDEFISLCMAPGTVFVGPNCRREEAIRLLAGGQWTLKTDVWVGQRHVWTSVPGEACSVWTMWDGESGKHLGWKLNPEAPLKRTGFGFDTKDHVLDAVIEPGFQSWRLKDEDELAEAVERGLFTALEAEEIRGTLSYAVEDFFGKRRDEMQKRAVWKPPQHWTLPVLNEDWNAL